VLRLALRLLGVPLLLGDLEALLLHLEGQLLRLEGGGLLVLLLAHRLAFRDWRASRLRVRRLATAFGLAVPRYIGLSCSAMRMANE
jgi:hypothetical protein